MNINSTNSCCGVGELESLYWIKNKKQAKGFLFDVAKDYFPEDNKFAFYFWADNIDNGGGRKLAEYIKSQNIGYVYNTRTKKNPNSGNYINAFIWNINNVEFRKWWRKNKLSTE